MYKQIIIARKDLGMSSGKLAAQVSHGSMAFISNLLRKSAFPITKGSLKAWDNFSEDPDDHEIICYDCKVMIEKELYEQWFDEAFTKTVLEAKNKNHLLKAKKMAEDLGMVEGEDYFLIYDACRTELEPEEVDKNGVGRTLTVIGFKPMDSEVIDKIGKKYQLYK